jgi:hypothetical protein
LAEDFLMNTRNAQYNQFQTINCEIEHPHLGWIPFTADPNDVEPFGRKVFQALKDTAAPYVSPPAPSEEEVTLALATEARNKRNALLTASDWTQVADAPVNKLAWSTYRKALRDLPKQEGFPHSVVWPKKP